MTWLHWLAIIAGFIAFAYVLDWFLCWREQKKHDLEGEDYGV